MTWILDALLMLTEGTVQGMSDEAASNKKITICRDCHSEGALKDSYCENCGSGKLTRKDKFLKEMTEKQHAEQILAKEKRRVYAVLSELEQLEARMECKNCKSYFEPGKNYCSSCGQPLEPTGKSECEATILRKYPWIATSAGQLQKLRKEMLRSQEKAQEAPDVVQGLEGTETSRTIKGLIARKSVKGMGKVISFIGKKLEDSSG